ncbi:hypothetical protein FACS1894132_04200 [Clostridia bacterium]|nr:hypothetical protein FACS1894132_04200 [Clostridia bacterium]
MNILGFKAVSENLSQVNIFLTENNAILVATSENVAPSIEPNATYTGAVVLTGLAVVFSALVVLILFMKVMGGVFAPKQKFQKEKKIPPSLPPEFEHKISIVKNNITNTVINNYTPQKTTTEEVIDDGEIIAVISATIACIYENTDTAYKITSIAPIRSRSQWSLAGLYDNTNPF